MNKQDKKIASQNEKMNSELTWDEAVDSVITTPQSQWSPYQIAVANLNPDLKSKNKKYQSALNARNVLENERVNLWQAWELMMNAYREAINYTKDASQKMMNANAANAALQAWSMVSWSAWLSTNPAAAAQTRLAAQNQVLAQNMQIRSNADQNLANLYWKAADIPATMASIWATNAQSEANTLQAKANANLANAQAGYYNRQPSSSWSSSYTIKWSNNKDDEKNESEVIIDWIDIRDIEPANIKWEKYTKFVNKKTWEIIEPTVNLLNAYRKYVAAIEQIEAANSWK